MLSQRNAKYLSQGCLALSLVITFVSYNSGLSEAIQSRSPDLIIHSIAFGVAVFLVFLSILISYNANRKR